MRNKALKTAYVIVVLCSLSYAFVALRGPAGIPGLLEKRRLVHEYETGNQKLARENEQLKQRIDRLANNPSAQEMEIRERLKLSGQHEKVFILDNAK